MKKLLLLLVISALATAASAQRGKAAPKFKDGESPGELRLSWPGKAQVPPAENPFNLPAGRRQPQQALQVKQATPNISITLGENGLPILMEGQTPASGNAADHAPVAERALTYLVSLKPQGLKNPENEWIARAVQTDEQGNHHVRLDQYFQGIPVWGGELIAHTRNGAFDRVNGRYFPTPSLASTTPVLSAEAAIGVVKNLIGTDKIKTSWTEAELRLIDGEPFSAELIVFHKKDALNGERLAWHIIARPNILTRSVYFVDAENGEIINFYDNTCNFVGHRHQGEACTQSIEHEHGEPMLPTAPQALVDGPVTIQGQDLFNINRTFINGGWQVGSQVVMEDASKDMFNANSSNMPNDPVGVIVTLDALNTSPQNNNFDYTLVVSASTTFTNKKEAISAHYNAGLSYDYFKSKFNRNSIDGVKGNILSFVKVSEDDGSSMENAFWNGAAMWYGSGGSVFKSLARGLDVGGHEMTHGVVEKTANLVYQNESGALNESFADIFGAMIDSDDWKIGEDVMQAGVNPTNCLRDLSNPHNGVNSNSPWWQPNHVNEQYMGSQDNGGVHINSGITNYAYYLFANNASVGKTKAEQVYYKALRDYLTKNSKFVDCRIAVIQAATDLYGATVANLAAAAFTQVGIGGSAPSGNYQGQLNTNPGTDYVLCVTNNQQNLDLANGSGTILKTVYNQGVLSRPSITDNGSDAVFVNTQGHIIGVSFNYNSNPIQSTTQVLSTNAEWRTAAISKDGRFIAALADVQEPYIYIFDLFTGESETYQLYNPTYSQGQATGDVQFADVLEFDYSGTNLMYDAYNELTNTQGEDIGYWDVGFLEFWDNNNFAAPADVFISKAFSGLPEKVGIGNPTFSKNSPFVIAFDLIDQSTATTRYDIYGANIETGDYDVIYGNNGTLGWPNYTRLDNKLMYEVQPNSGIYNLRQQGIAANKIQPSGGSTAFISNHSWGVWYGNGNRNLSVNIAEPTPAVIRASVAPNPVVDVTNLQLWSVENADAQIRVFNLLGQSVMEQNHTLTAGDNTINLNLASLPTGSYVLQVLTNSGSAALTLVKE